MDEESVKPCIQDRLRSVAMRSKDIFTSWPVISLILIISIFIVALPKILTHLIGSEVLIPIFSELSLESRFVILFSSLMVVVSVLQYNINKSILRIEEQRIQPIVFAEVSSGSPIIFVENKGGGMAWNCKINLERLDLEGFYEKVIKKIYPWSGEQIYIPDEWITDVFDLYVGIEYYTKEDMPTDSLRKWARIFKKIGPIFQY